MLEPLIMQTRAPAPAAANGGVPAGSDAGDAGAFENMLQAGLTGRTDSDAGTPMPAIQPGAKSAENSDASADGPDRQPADDAESISLAALLAYSAGVAATTLPADTRSLRRAAEPALAGLPTATADSVSAVGTGAGGLNLKAQEVKELTSDPLSARLGHHGGGSPAMPATADVPADATLSAPVIVPPEPARAAPSDAPSATPPARTAGSAAGFALPRDPMASAAADAGTARAGDSPAMLRALGAPAAAANNAADDRPSKQERPARPEDLRSPAEPVVADAARQREDLMNALQPAHSHQPGERPSDRSADRPAEIAARIDALDTMVRADMARGSDTFPAGAPERAGPVPLVYVEQGLGSTGWKQEFGSQVTLLVSRREPQAEIRINPPQLGPVEVRIGLQGDQVSLAFTAAQPDTRAAIENALPQLHEMFAEGGLALGNASVNAESSQQRSPRGTHQNGMSRPHEEPSEVMPALRSVDMRLVDTFA